MKLVKTPFILIIFLVLPVVSAETLTVNAPTTVTVGDPVPVDITIANANNLMGAQLDVTYDASVVTLNSVVEGTFFSQAGSIATTFIGGDTSIPGTISNIVIVRTEKTPASGGGTVLSLTFTATQIGTTNIAIANGILGDDNAQSVAVTVVPASVAVQSPPTPPTNNTNSTNSTPPPVCSCTGWVDTTCGAGSCGSGEMQQTRSCSPAACSVEVQCVAQTACNPTTTPSSGGGGGGGGGGGAYPVRPPTTTAPITPTDKVSHREANKDRIDIDLKQAVVSPAISLKRIESNLPPQLESKLTYKAFSILRTNFNGEDVASTQLRIAVPNTWFTEAGIEEEDTLIYGYTGGAWTELTIQKAEHDQENVYFVTESENIEAYAIGANTPGDGVNTAVVQEEMPESIIEQEARETRNISFMLVAALIALTLLTGLHFYLQKKKAHSVDMTMDQATRARLSTYVTQMRKRDISDHSIKHELRSVGWDDHSINAILKMG